MQPIVLFFAVRAVPRDWLRGMHAVVEKVSK
jgi:hypothetical protein